MENEVNLEPLILQDTTIVLEQAKFMPVPIKRELHPLKAKALYLTKMVVESHLSEVCDRTAATAEAVAPFVTLGATFALVAMFLHNASERIRTSKSHHIRMMPYH